LGNTAFVAVDLLRPTRNPNPALFVVKTDVCLV
jgi:hypothetical protein